MKARVAAAAWTLALVSVALLAMSLRGAAPVRASLGWSWFILSLLAAGVVAVVLMGEPARPAGGETP